MASTPTTGSVLNLKKKPKKLKRHNRLIQRASRIRKTKKKKFRPKRKLKPLLQNRIHQRKELQQLASSLNSVKSCKHTSLVTLESARLLNVLDTPNRQNSTWKRSIWVRDSFVQLDLGFKSLCRSSKWLRVFVSYLQTLNQESLLTSCRRGWSFVPVMPTTPKSNWWDHQRAAR